MTQFLARWWVGIATALALLMMTPQLEVPVWLVLLLPVSLLVFVLPGHLFTQSFFAAQGPSLPERLLIMLLSGMATCVLGGLFLYRTGAGFGALSWGIVFGTIAICAGIDLALLRPNRCKASEVPPKRLGLSWGQIGLLATALLIVVIANMLIQTPNSSAAFQGYTQLWLHPCHNVDKPTILVGVDSREFADTTYRLDVHQGGKTPVASSIVHLKPGEGWQGQIPLVGALDPAKTLDVFLYRADNPTEIYRHVALRRPHWLSEKVNEIANSHCQR